MPTRKAIWKSDSQFNAGSPVFDKTEVIGSGDIARVQLEKIAGGVANVPFTDPLDYDYDPAEIEVTLGAAKLKAQAGATDLGDFPYTIPANYNYDLARIEVAGGEASLFNAEVSEQHNWPYTDIGNYTIEPLNSIDIILGEALLHDAGAHTNNAHFNYNFPAEYTYDPAKIEFFDVGGPGNKACRLIATGTLDPHAWYHLNESSGVQASDSSSHGRDGTCMNMDDADWVAGKLNNCLRFDGTNEYVDCGLIADFERTDAFSLECWFRTSSAGTFYLLSNSGAGHAKAVFMSAGKVYVRLMNTYNTNEIRLITTGTYNDGAWHHLIVTYDGSSTAAGTELYIAGVPAAYTIAKDSLSATIISGSIFQISGYLGTGYCFDGDIDEVVIYDKELSSGEVTFRWNAGAGTEAMPGGTAVDNPTVVSNLSIGFGAVLEWKDFIESVTTPPTTEVKYNLSNDNGVTWYWWDGGAWAVADGTYAKSNIGTVIDTNFPSFAIGSSTIRVKAFLHSDDGSATPVLDNVQVIWYDILIDYVTDGRITTDIGLDKSPDPVHSWDAFAESVVEPANTEVRYVLSNDDGSTWLYWNGAAWVLSNGSTWGQFSSGTDVTNNIGSFPTTNPKMKVRAYLKTTDTTVSPRLSNVQVSYHYGYNYDTNSPPIRALFDVGSGADPLIVWTDFIETATVPGSTEIRYVLSDDSGANWKWWNGVAWVISNGTISESNTVADVNTNIGTFPIVNKTIRVIAFLTSSDSTVTPKLDNIQVRWIESPVSYSTTPQVISMDTDIQPVAVGEWTETTETVILPANTEIKYQYSIDSGGTWNGAWLTEPELEAAITAIVCNNDGTDKIRFKFQLHTTDANETPEIDNLQIDYAASYESEGSYTSHAYVPVPSTANGIFAEEITFDIVTPTNTTLKVRARTVNHVLEENYSDPWTEYSSGDDMSWCGHIIQFKADFTSSNPAASPRLNWCEIEFHTLIGLLRSIDSHSEFLENMESGKWEISTLDGGTMIFYKEDNVTEVARFALYKMDGVTRTYNPADISIRVRIPSP